LKGIDKLLLISGVDIGKRNQQHQNVIWAVQKNKVNFISYTSILNADKSKIFLASENLFTENIIKGSCALFAILRNSWYIENYFTNLSAKVEHVMIVIARDGKVSERLELTGKCCRGNSYSYSG
jgi:NAD(P)H dehydrogenase (quinone)